MRRLLIACFAAAAFACGEGAARAEPSDVPASAATVSASNMEEARRHFQLGLRLLRDPEGEQVEAAFLEFKIAHDLSKSPRVLGNIGYCAMKLERNSESVAAYREYLRVVPNVDPAERTQIEQDLGTMIQGAATITVSFEGEGAWTLVDERDPMRGDSITNVYGPTQAPLTLLVRPGHHVIHVRVGTETQSTWEIDATGGATFAHAFAPKPPPPLAVVPTAVAPLAPLAPRSARPAAPWIGIGVGGALLTAGAVTGVIALGRASKLESECPANRCPSTSGYRADLSAARTLATVTDVLLVGGSLAAAGGAAWLFFGSKQEASAPQPAIGAACAPGGCAVSLKGAF